MAHPSHYVLTAVFLALVFGVPLTQAGLELAAGERPVVAELFDEPPSEDHLRSFETSLEDASWFGERLRPAYQRLSHRLTGDLGKKAVVGRDGWLFYEAGVRYLTQPYFRGEDGSAPENGDPVAAIGEFAEELSRRGIHLMVVPVPDKASILVDRVAWGADPDQDVSAHTRRFMDELRSAGIDVVDLHESFRLHRRQRGDEEPLYLRTDTHWTGAGVRLAAETLAARIREQPWFAATGTRYRHQPLRVGRRGDIVTMSEIPGAEDTFPEEDVECRQVVTESGEPYADDPASPILLLGDSFSRIYESDAPRSAGLVANLAYELQQPLSSIVNDGGASTLVRQQLARRPEMLEGKRLVVWEFAERDIRFGLQGWQRIRIWPDDGSPAPRAIPLPTPPVR